MKPIGRCLAVAILGAALALAVPRAALALTGFENDWSLPDSSDEFVRGYIAGSLDMLSVLENGEVLVDASFATKARRILACAGDKTLGDIETIYRRYAEASHDYPPQGQVAATSLLLALDESCGNRRAPPRGDTIPAFNSNDRLLQHDEKGYRFGYIASAVDMLAGLDDTRHLEASFDAAVRQVLACVAKGKTIGDLHDIYDRYLAANPSKRPNVATGTLYNAIKNGCGI